MGDVVGSNLETLRLVGLSSKRASQVTGVYIPTSQRSFSMPVYYRLQPEDNVVTMTKLSITQIDRHSYGWTVQDADMEILVKAVYPKEKLVSSEPFCLPQHMNTPCWKILSTVGAYRMQSEAKFEVCPSPFATAEQLQEMNMEPANRDVLSATLEKLHIPDSDDDTSDEETDSHEFPYKTSSVDSKNETQDDIGDDDFPSIEHRRSTVISQRWTTRLGEMPATQGRMSTEVNDAGAVFLKVRPAWPDWLQDISFDVVKINRFGKRQRRQLKLTRNHILNIKDGKDVSRLHPYDQIARVHISKLNRCIVEFNAEENGRRLEYKTNDAAQIVQQISTRIKVRESLQKISPESLMSSSTSTWRDSYSKERKPISCTISSEKHNRDSNVLEFIKSLGMLANSVCESLSLSVIPSTLTEAEKESFYKRSVNMISGSVEELTKRTVEDILLNKSTSAGSTRTQFIENYSRKNAQSGELVDLRHFIDGMHGYLLQHHIKKLAAIMTCGNDTNVASLSQVEEHIFVSISYIVFTVTENAMFSPLSNTIHSKYFESFNRKSLEIDTCRRLHVLSKRQQNNWDISPYHISPAGWSSAIFELAGIERNPTQSLRLQALVHTAKAIYSEFKCEILPLLSSRKGASLTAADAMLGADDFLPIFIYVICQAQLRYPNFNKDLLWALCHPDQLRGESGYYLTMYESAIEYIMAAEMSQDELRDSTFKATDIFPVSGDTVFNF